ncbi:MAG: hypothetical protein EA383_17840 [Spirochaetaceae bacterium]|nr:MAG: hypothetical protein EA383_17840 [Spirochaetaceae bacterium]
MAEIKSALELALERTADVKSDKASLTAHDNKQKGRKLLSEYFDDPTINLKKRLKDFDREHRPQIRRGLFDALLGNLTLPSDENHLTRIQALQPAFEAVLDDSRHLPAVFDQITSILQQYIRDRKQLVDQLRQQFEGKIRQREQELARQTGQQIRLDPAQDPEFSKTLQHHMTQLTTQYQQVVDQAREQIEGLYKA